MRILTAACFAALSTLAFMGVDAGSDAQAQTGMASYYRHGKVTANGERFNPGGMTAAHRSLPFGTKVRVVHLKTGRAVIVRINDRGPFVRGRIIDLSLGAARKIGLHNSGVAKVRVEVMN